MPVTVAVVEPTAVAGPVVAVGAAATAAPANTARPATATAAATNHFRLFACLSIPAPPDSEHLAQPCAFCERGVRRG